MAKTVNEAFYEFMRKSVDLSDADYKKAIDSEKNVVAAIQSFDDDGYFQLCGAYNERFGSFARKTKIQPLNDIDLMFGLSGYGGSYNEFDPIDNVRIWGNANIPLHRDCMNQYGVLDSIKVLNKFKNRIKQRYPNSNPPIRNDAAVILDFVSTEWTFDIVPCFFTTEENDHKTFFLIPNGSGNWQKTDPRLDRAWVNYVEKKGNYQVRKLIRLCKKWFAIKKIKTPASYLLETLIVRYCNSLPSISNYIDLEFRYALKYIKDAIYAPIMDLKNIQGNLNNLDFFSRYLISQKAQKDSEIAYEAFCEEVYKRDDLKAINLWRDIFGQEFPTYG